MATKKASTKKVTAKKAATKKVASKAAAPKKTAARGKSVGKRPLVTAADEHSFWTTDGQVLNNLVALMEALKDMDKAVYQYHVAKDRHDFADWVESVLNDVDCATSLRTSKTPKSAHTVVVRHLKLYQL